MPEVLDDINYEVNSDDPKPKPSLSDKDRAKLDGIVKAMVKNKESDKVIQAVVNDFKSKYATIPQATIQQQSAQSQTPEYKIDISQPTFKSIPTQLPTKTFKYDKPLESTDILKLQGKAKVAQTNLDNEIQNNTKALGKVIVADRLREQQKRQEAGIYGVQPTDKLFITNEDIQKIREEAANYRDRANQVLSAIVYDEKDKDKAKEVQKNAYLIDAFNNAAQDENGNKRVSKIETNAKAIEKGDLLYDHNKQLLIKPQGFFSSLFEARNELNRVSDAYDRTKLMQDNGNIAGIISELNARMKRDPDEAIPVAQGALGELGHMIGGQTIKGLTAGSIAAVGTTALGNPEAAGAAFQLASGAMNAVDMYKIGKQNALEQNYARLKNEHPDMPDYDAYVRANDLAEKQAMVDAASAAAMQYFGAKVGFGAAKQLRKGLSAGLSEIKDDLGKKAFEAVGIGGIGSASQVVKNIMAQKSGLNVPTSEGALDQLQAGILMTGAMAMLGAAGDQLKKATKNRLSYGLSQMPEEAINNGLNKLQETGQLTPEQTENVKNIINEQKLFEQSIPKNLSETDRLKIGAKIKERSLLKQQLEQVDEAFHPELKERIKKLNEDILKISKGEDRGELQQLVNKSINNNEVQGFAIEPLQHASEGELKKYMKEIAEQAHDPNSAAMTLETFGENIVNKAKELFPKEEKPVEEIGHIEITEHGEDTKTADGLENGIKPSELSKEGIKEAKELGRELADSNKNRIVTSEIERAKQTANEAVKEAKNISGKDIPVETNKLLNTWDIGEYDGKPEGTFIEQAWINKPDEAPKGGESFNDFKSRMEEAYKYVKSLPEDTHVVGHSKVMRALSALEKTDGRWTDETTKDFLTNKELTNAIQEPSTGSILQYPQEGTGGEGSERGRMEPGEQGEISSRTHSEEEGKATGDKKEVGGGGIPPNMFDLPFTPEEGDVSRLAHADTEQLYREMGMGERIPRATKTDIKLEEEADNLIKEGYDFNGKADRVLNGTDKSFSDAEQVAFAKMVGALKAKLNNTPINLPEFNEIQRQIEKLSRASDIVGSEEGAAFRARRMFVLNNESLSDFLTRAKQANKDAPLTEEQTKEVKKQWDEFDAAKKDYEQKIAKLEDQLAKAKAEKKVKAAASTTKKVKRTKEDYVKERKDIIAAMRADLLKVAKGGGGALSSVPGAAQLQAIAPHVMKLVKSLIEEGVDKLEDVVKNIHEQIKDIVEGIKEKDIHDIIAGEYNEKKGTRSEIAEKLYNVKKQAELINKLERLRAGVEPKSEKALRKRNQEIEALKKQIKELEGRPEKTDEEKLTALKNRYKKLAEEYERRIKEGDFEKDADVPPIVLDKEAQEAKDKYIEAKKKWELSIAKQEYENRTWKQKWADYTLGVLELRRAIGTAFDFSVPFRQALPVTINPLRLAETGRAFKEMFTQWYSGKSLDRWWFDLENSTDYKEMLEDEVPVHSPNELRISKREEEFRTRLAEEIPIIGKGVKMSNRAASGYLNSLRVDMYRKMRKMMEARGITRQNNPEVYKELGKYIGNMTGSGNLLSYLEGKPSKALGTIFFGARLMAAKFNILNPFYYGRMPKEIIKTALIDLAMRVGMYTTIGYLFKAAGLSVSLDPNDSDFLKVKHGNTTYDITGGEAIYVRTATRILRAAWERISGEEKSSLKTAEKAADATKAFFRNKLAPTPSYGLDMFLGKTAWGAKADPYDIVRIYPMWIDDIVEDWEQDKANSILLAGIPSIMGIGVMSKQNKKGGSSGGAGASGHYKEQKTNKNKEHKHK